MSFLAIFQGVWAFRLPIFLALAFASGAYITHRFDTNREEATLTKALANQVETINHDVLKAQERGIALTAAIRESDVKVDAIKVQIKPRIIYVKVPAKVVQPINGEKTNVAIQPAETQPDLSVPYLDQRTVRLLNDARTELPPTDAPAVSNGEESSPSGTSVEAVIQSDLEITKMYKSLAKRHDELVDYVTEEMKKRDTKK